ncbi:MAG TPA: plastocyanin/azurin family copper-binding protein [Solirubrobacteraceae bacterium]|nr:plastocyanin/azurin family copper-binding protein [Solirubrobacteraceae bacterium]
MRKLTVSAPASAGGLVTASLVAALLVVAVAPAFAATTKVKVGDNYFVRASGVPTVTVSKGTKVSWVWKGSSSHNVKVTRGPAKFGSSTLRSGTFSKRVTKPGTYTIVCTVHGASDQSMKLVVR